MANGKNKKKRLIIISVVAVAVVALVIVAVAATRGGTKIDPTKLAKVEKGDLAKSVVATGKVTPITKVEIKSKASGIVKKLFVDAGDRVHTGQVLAELDRDEIEAQVNSSRAQLLSSEANMKGAEADMKRAEVDAQGVDIPTLQRAYERAQERINAPLGKVAGEIRAAWLLSRDPDDRSPDAAQRDAGRLEDALSARVMTFA